MSRRQGIRGIALFLLFFMCAGFCGTEALPTPAFADEGEVITIVIPRSEDERETDVRIGQVQEWLTDLGYYEGDQTMTLDAATRFALYTFCQRNGLPYSERGVTQQAWDMLSSGKGKPAPAEEEPPDYHDIAFGAQGDEVLALQSRLKELGYFSDDAVLTAGLFNDGTQRAIELFCESNLISYSGTGAPASVQYFLFSQAALAYEPPVVKESLSEKVLGYFSRQVPMLGSSMPMFFLWICGAVIVILILVLAVYFFVPGRESSSAVQGSAPVPRYWRKTLNGSAGAGIVAMEKLSASGNLLDFQVHYDGTVTNIQCACKPTLAIGRSGTNQIVLNPSDIAASNSHCELYYRGAVLMLRDHSSNGTTVNGRMIHKSECRLNPGDQIGIGSHILVIQF